MTLQTTWKRTRILTEERIRPKKRSLATSQAASFSQQEWLAHLAKPGSQGGCAATPVVTSHTRHVPAKDHTHAAYLARVIKPRFRRCLGRVPLRKALLAWSFPGAIWRLLVDSTTYRGRQRHGIGYERRATRLSVFDEGFSRTFLEHGCFSANPRCWHVSQGQQQWQARHSWTAVGSPTAGNVTMLQASATVGVLLNMEYCKNGTEQPRRISRQHSTTSPMPSRSGISQKMCRIRPGLWQPALQLWSYFGQPCMPTNIPQRICATFCRASLAEEAHSTSCGMLSDALYSV